MTEKKNDTLGVTTRENLCTINCGRTHVFNLRLEYFKLTSQVLKRQQTTPLSREIGLKHKFIDNRW
jgi:hypothetical protein